jgi:hypothetical protein
MQDTDVQFLWRGADAVNGAHEVLAQVRATLGIYDRAKDCHRESGHPACVARAFHADFSGEGLATYAIC